MPDFLKILKFDVLQPQTMPLPDAPKVKRQRVKTPVAAPSPSAVYEKGQEGNVAGFPVQPLRYDGIPVPPESF